ncbi:META domain-containing protein [Vitreimonas sp.]|jgi:heat shock protein HslJ|uniref:META domain-containing protein n=1 Tax=Vitreimonas sp. TaxID=3069702 RepID=UPI002ED7E027
MTLTGAMRFVLNRTNLTGLALASALVAAACASTAPEPPLSGTRWVAQSIEGAPVAYRTPTIEFAADRISGTGGCNRFFGGYTISGDRISFGGVGATEMACEPVVMAQEAAFHTALSSAQTYRREGETLILSSSAGEALVFRAAQ